MGRPSRLERRMGERILKSCQVALDSSTSILPQECPIRRILFVSQGVLV